MPLYQYIVYDNCVYFPEEYIYVVGFENNSTFNKLIMKKRGRYKMSGVYY